MCKQTDITRVPKLRFPEFEGDWKTKTLGEVIDIKSASRVHKDEWTETGVPFFRSSDVVSDWKRIKNRKAFISRQLFDELSAKSGRVERGDLLVTGGGSIGIPYIVKSDDPLYFKDADLLWFRLSGRINSHFLYTFLLSAIFRKYLKAITHIGTIAHYTIIQAKNTPIALPNDVEQTKIAAFLSAVDKKINQLERKKELLEQYKKGCMQKLFSQEIRFKDENGNDFPEWEEKKISDVFRVTRGQVLAASKTEKYETADSFYPVYSSQTKSNGLMGFYSEFLFESALTWTTDGANAGNVKFRPGKFYCTNVCGVLLSDEGFANNCVAELLDRVTHKYVSYVGNPKLMNNVMGGIKISFPSVDEQKVISKFLTKLNIKLSQVSDELSMAKAFKKGLLQQMFV